MKTFTGLLLLTAVTLFAEEPPSDALLEAIQSHSAASDHNLEETLRSIDDALWHFNLGDVANIDKFEIASSKPRRAKNPAVSDAGNALTIPVYVFSPKKLQGKAPLLVFVHGGVHWRLTPNHAHIFREAIERGYVIVSPEYRGSKGHGAELYDEVDYGGAEIDDVHDARNWAVEALDFVDGSRVGIFGWSRGAYLVLMNVLQWPEHYKAACAGVPVVDLVPRRAFIERFIGKLEGGVEELRRRSPVSQLEKLNTPLLIHATTSDEEVPVREVEQMIAGLKSAGKKFESKIYQDAPGGHRFDRLDTKLAKDARREMWEFLGRNLK